MRISRYVVFGAVALLGVSTLALAQRGPGGGMWRGGGNYDPATEVTLAGTIDEVRQMRPNGPGACICC